MSYSIKFDSGVTDIEVNNGTIQLKNDAVFIKAVMGVQDTFKSLYAKYSEITSDNSTASKQERDDAVDSLFSGTDAAINALFGSDACEKIFHTPRTTTQYEDFFDGLIRIIDEQQAKQAAKLDEHTPQNRQQRREMLRKKAGMSTHGEQA